MRSVVFACLISIGIAAPNGGYNYVTPSYNSVQPSPAAQHVHHHHIVQPHTFHGLTSAPVQQFITNHAIGTHAHTQPSHGHYQQAVNPQVHYNAAPSGFVSPQASYSSGFNTAPALPAFNGFGQQSGGIHKHQGHRQVLPPLVTKHIYIHSAPEEPDEEIYDDSSVQQERRHYNIVFIKAPSQTVHKTALTVAKALNEEKTVIYVLSKKNDVSEIRQALSDVGHQPQKPEVFFIKYKTPEEAQHAQSTIQAQYDALGGSTRVSDEGFAPVSSVIGALGENGGYVGGAPSSVQSGEGQVISGGSAISSISGGSHNAVSSGSGNLFVGGSPYLPPSKIKKY